MWALILAAFMMHNVQAGPKRVLWFSSSSEEEDGPSGQIMGELGSGFGGQSSRHHSPFSGEHRRGQAIGQLLLQEGVHQDDGVSRYEHSDVCDDFLEEIDTFFVNIKNNKSPRLQESTKGALCHFLLNSIAHKEQFVAHIVASKAHVYLPAFHLLPAHLMEQSVERVPLMVGYRLEQSDLYIDFHAGALQEDELSVFPATLAGGSYKCPHKVITYNVMKSIFSRGVFYPRQRTKESTIANSVYPGVYNKKSVARRFDDTREIQYNYAHYVGLDLYAELQKRRDSFIGNVGFFDALVGQIQCFHEQGVRHNDLKPSNIFVSDMLQPIVGDFGFSAKVDDVSLLVGDVIGATDVYAHKLVTKYCNPVQNGYVEKCLAIRQSQCIDLYALEKIAEELGVAYSPIELRECNAWVERLLSSESKSI